MEKAAVPRKRRSSVRSALSMTCADMNVKDNKDWTALMWASWYNFPELAKLLLESGVDVNAQSSKGNTALMFAADHNSADVAEPLLAAGADVNKNKGVSAKPRWRMRRPIIQRTWRGFCSRRLIEAGADVNAKDNDGDTALIIATDCDFDDVAELLKAAGARR